MSFDPLDYMNSSDAANIPIMNSTDETAFKDFTDQVLGDLIALKPAGGQT